MSLPRIQFLRGFITEAGAPDMAEAPLPGDASPGGLISWRLLGSNNREMGRSVRSYAHLQAGQEAVRQLQGGLGDATRAVTVDLSSGLWRWKLLLNDVAVVSSGRSFQRKLDSEQSLARLMEAVPGALVTDTILVRRVDQYATVNRHLGKVHAPQHPLPSPVHLAFTD